MSSSTDEQKLLDASSSARIEPNLSPPLRKGKLAGESSDYVPKWYVLRIRYNHDKKAYEELRKAGIDTYFATTPDYKGTGDELVTQDKPLLPGFLFAHESKVNLEKFMHSRSPMAEYVWFYRNRTKARMSDGKHEPLTIKDEVMNSFIVICEARNKHSHVFSEEELKKITPGAYARVIGGYFKGVEGRIVKVNRKTCILVDVNGICYISTSYIPKPFLKIEEDIPR